MVRAGFASTPSASLITNRYLKHQKRLAQEALSRLIGDEAPEADEVAENSCATKRRLLRSRSASRINEWERSWQLFAAAGQSEFSILDAARVGS